MQNFVHLRVHSEYSITDSILKVSDIVDLAHKDQMYAVTVTDLHNMFALIKFYKAARACGIKPIVGAEVNIESQDKILYKVLMLAKNNAGYKDLCELITRSYVSNKIADIPYIKEEWLFGNVWHNLIVLSGGYSGDIGQLIIQNQSTVALNKAKNWALAFPDSYYIELQRINHPHTNLLIEESVYIAHELKLPVVATHPVQFGSADDYEAHEVRVCVADSCQLDDERRVSKFTDEQYFMSQAEMIERFLDIPSSINNTIEIAKRCNFEITLGKYFLPNFATPNGLELNEYLSILSFEGLDKRLKEIYPNEITRLEHEVVYRTRLETEIETIIQMGFPGYFLIVADFINWAKQNNVPVGPGRGSGAGSLVAFVLGITDIEPLRYGLLFERFLNPERVSMPDFDIDFCQDKRELVIEYVKQKYGADAVAQIATFGTMSSKAVIKDVGRVLGLPYGLCDSISKLILNTPAKSFGLQEAYVKFDDLKDKIDNADDEVQRLWDLSLQLEDLTRSVGKHAAGVLIAPSKLTDFCPLYLADGMQTSQLDKDDVESVGLVKFDFLGLRNLTIIQEALVNIKQLNNIDLKLSNYDFSDHETYKLLQSGNTAAIFQLESRGMRRVLIKLEPDCFEDIIALIALYRPGPLGSGMVDDFIKRKKGEQVADYFHDDLKVCLEPTYGVIVYQEQVMQISQIIGGYTLGGADLLRRAMGKKKPEEMAKHKNIFVDGALKKGYAPELADNLFDLMAKFADYGFNKSHSAAYAVISYHTAYLKTHYLTSFMAATLSSELDNTDKLYEFYQDCVENEIELLPPDINKSGYRFIPVDANKIRYALGAVKGVGQNAVEMLIDERNKDGDFTDFIDFCRRSYKKIVNKRTIENLVKAGAFDALDGNRAKLFNNINKILEHIEQCRANENQGSLFELLDDNLSEDLDSEYIELEYFEEWHIRDKLGMEKEAIGYYFSGSLFEEYRDLVRKLDITPLSKYSLANDDMQEFINSRAKEKVDVCGVINYIGSRPLKKGGKMYFVKIEDDSGEIEFVLYNDVYEEFRALIKEDEFVFVEGELTYDQFRNEIKITAKKIYNLDTALSQYVMNVTIHIEKGFAIDKLAPMLGDEGVKLLVNYNNGQSQCKLSVDKKFINNYDNIKTLSGMLNTKHWSIG
jgi:DNA polymerase-3 subunit alpha